MRNQQAHRGPQCNEYPTCQGVGRPVNAKDDATEADQEGHADGDDHDVRAFRGALPASGD